jgi:hypothetical protein
MSQNPVRNVRGRSSPQGRAHAQSPGNLDKITGRSLGQVGPKAAMGHFSYFRLFFKSGFGVWNLKILVNGRISSPKVISGRIGSELRARDDARHLAVGCGLS